MNGAMPILLSKRLSAGLIDLLIYGVLKGVLVTLFSAVGLAFAGSVLAVLYMLLRDSLPFLHYQSIGKKLLRLRVYHNGMPRLSYEEGVKRNFIFIPDFLNALGWAFFYIGSGIMLILLTMEAYVAYTRPDHRRLGDQWADTDVRESMS